MRRAHHLRAVVIGAALASLPSISLAAQTEGGAGAHAELLGAGVLQACLTSHIARGIDRLAKAQEIPYDSMAVMALRNFRGQGIPDTSIVSMLCGEVHPGMPQAMAMAAWDRPARKVIRETEDGNGERWIYADGRELIILDGRVYSVTEAEGS